MVRIIGGKGITFVVSNSSSTLPPIVQPRIAARMYPKRLLVADASAASPCLARYVLQANRKSDFLAPPSPIGIDTVRRKATTRRIQSSADFVSIQGGVGFGF